MNNNNSYAFVEFEEERDAEDAYEALKHSRIDGRDISIQWSRKSPAKGWR